MIDSISPVSVNKVSFRGEMPAQNTNSEKSESKSSKSWMLWTGLAALAAGGIYLATRGKAGEKSVINAAGSAEKTTGSSRHISEVISFNQPEDKKLLDKIQQKIDNEWKLLKELPSGNYVKNDSSYVPAADLDKNYISLTRMSAGNSHNIAEIFKDGVTNKIIQMDEKGKVINYESRNYAVGFCLNGEDVVSSNCGVTLKYSAAKL